MDDERGKFVRFQTVSDRQLQCSAVCEMPSFGEFDVMNHTVEICASASCFSAEILSIAYASYASSFERRLNTYGNLHRFRLTAFSR